MFILIRLLQKITTIYANIKYKLKEQTAIHKQIVNKHLITYFCPDADNEFYVVLQNGIVFM